MTTRGAVSRAAANWSELVQQRRRVQRVGAEPLGDLLARGPRPSRKSSRRRSPVSGRRHDVLADFGEQVLPELGRPNPGAQVVGRVEARIHVRGSSPPGSGSRSPPSVAPNSRSRSLRPPGKRHQELELELELRGVATESRPPGTWSPRRSPTLLVGEAEVLGVPARLSRDRLDDVRVDLVDRGRGRSCERCRAAPGRSRRSGARAPPRPGTPGSRAGRPARDQVDEVRRIRRDHAGARRLLRPVVEVEPDTGIDWISKPSRRSVSTHTGTERSFVYMDSSGESRRR